MEVVQRSRKLIRSTPPSMRCRASSSRRDKTITLCGVATIRCEDGVATMEAMLYQICDWHRSALEPWRLFAQTANELYGHPDSPLSYLPGARNVAAAFDLMTRLTQRYERPEFGITSVRCGERDYAVSEVVPLANPFSPPPPFPNPTPPPHPPLTL